MASPRPPSSSSRAPNGKPGSSASYVVSKKSDRPPGTPRRETNNKEKEKAQDAECLSEFRFGDLLGKGAFGAVYKAMNMNTGETVAVKQIKLKDLPASEHKMIEGEIALLKNLQHDNIVKYLGFARSAKTINIILEYCENGSLHSICKNYGKFPENLVGIYMAQVLQGLLYLHMQGVVHRDIKGANILTTKDGKVKLADFGVSTSTLPGKDKEAQVVGTPYWMAPEVIQLSNATTASDIWSLGATVIELLEGNPPYHHMQPMPALFAIVNDDHPPLPQGASRAARDFLLQCFQKDPNLRVEARRLLKHVWITSSRRMENPVHKNPTNYTEAVEEVKQWNEALRSPGALTLRVARKTSGSHPLKRDAPLRNIQNETKALGKSTPLKHTAALARPKTNAEAFRSPENPGDDNWDDDFLSDISPNGLRLPQLKPQDHFGGLLSSEKLKAIASDKLRAFASTADLSLPTDTEQEDNWDANFEGDIDYNTVKGPIKFSQMKGFEISNSTVRPAERKPTAPTGKQVSKKPSEPKMPQMTPQAVRTPKRYQNGDQNIKPALKHSKPSMDTYSSVYGDDGSVFDASHELLRKENIYSPKLFDIADFNGLNKKSTPMNGLNGISTKQTLSSAKIQQYVEIDGDGDFSDIVSENGSEEGGALRLIPKDSGSSWPLDEDDEKDPFDSLVPDDYDEHTMRANLARDKAAKMSSSIKNLVALITITQTAEILLEASDDLLDMLFQSPDSRDDIINSYAMIPILEVLDGIPSKSHDLIVRFLRLVNALISNDVPAQQLLCSAGGIPTITKYSDIKFPESIRLESAAFVRQMYSTDPSILQLFVCAGGLNILVEFLKEDYDVAKDLVLIGVNGIWNVFELQTIKPRNDFPRILSRNRILSPLSEILSRVLDEKLALEGRRNTLNEQVEDRIVSIFMLFSKGEAYVKEVSADRMVLKSVLKDLRRMFPKNQVKMLKFIKNLSMLSTTLDAIHSSNAMELLIKLVKDGMNGGQSHFREICNEFVSIIFHLCRLNKARQADAAREGVIALLLRLLEVPDLKPFPKEFVYPTLCDMAHSGRFVTKYLWQNEGLDFYISLLSDQSWQVMALDAIYTWHQEEIARVEEHLLKGTFSKAIINCFGGENFDFAILDPLQKLLRLSPAVAETLAKPTMFSNLTQKLSHRKPDIRLNLLRLVCCIAEPRNGHTSTLRRCGLLGVIEGLAEKEPTILVKNVAKDFLTACLEQEERESSGGRRRNISGISRTSSYNVPSDQSPPYTPSTPVTPSSKGRSSYQVTDYPEEPVTPQRRPITPMVTTPGKLMMLSRQRSGESQFWSRRPSLEPEGILSPRQLNLEPEGFLSPRRPSFEPESFASPRRLGEDASNVPRRPSADGGVSSSKSRLPRNGVPIRPPRPSVAVKSSGVKPTGAKDQQTSSPARKEKEKETSSRARGDTKSIDSPRPRFSAVSRRTKTQSSQDLKSSERKA